MVFFLFWWSVFLFSPFLPLLAPLDFRGFNDRVFTPASNSSQNWREHPQPKSYGSLPRNSDVLKMEVAPSHPVIMSILVFFKKLQVTWPSDRCLGEEHRDGIDLYYAHVQLLSERDLQRRDWHFYWPWASKKLKGTFGTWRWKKNMIEVKHSHYTLTIYKTLRSKKYQKSWWTKKVHQTPGEVQEFRASQLKLNLHCRVFFLPNGHVWWHQGDPGGTGWMG